MHIPAFPLHLRDQVIGALCFLGLVVLIATDLVDQLADAF